MISRKQLKIPSELLLNHKPVSIILLHWTDQHYKLWIEKSSIFGSWTDWENTDPKLSSSSFIQQNALHYNWTESCCVKWDSIWLHLQSSLFLPAHWPSTTQAAIYWWQLTYSTGWGTFALVFFSCWQNLSLSRSLSPSHTLTHPRLQTMTHI